MKEYSKSSRLPDSENLVSHRAAMSMLYLASSTATSAVRLSGRLAPSRSKRVHCRRKMRSSSAVLGNPGDGRSGMKFHAVVHLCKL